MRNIYYNLFGKEAEIATQIPVNSLGQAGSGYLRRRRQAFTLAEVVVSLSILLLMIVMVSAAFPSLISMTQSSSDYQQAAEIAEHKIEELRAVGLCNPDAVGLGNLGVIDNPQPVPEVANPSNAPGDAFSYSFTSIDSLANYFSSDCQGILTISPDSNVAGADDVIVTIEWQRPGAGASSYVLQAKVVNV